MWWLLESDCYKKIQAAEKAGITPTADQQVKFEVLASNSTSRILSSAGNIAEISIIGVLTQAPSFFAMLFGGGNTTYPEIISAIAEAEIDPSINEIILAIDSPGGHFDGLFDTLAAIQSATKPIKAIISNLGASGAFAIASQADEIIASNIAARIGSLGVAVTFDIDPNEITIASSNAPKKRPDVSTDEGVAVVRDELDAMHDIFVKAIASGRNTSVDNVNVNFGQGGMFLASEALKRGMIDGIANIVDNTDSITTAAINGGDNLEKKPMDLNTFKSSHPSTYAEAVNEGVTSERDRITAHLTMGNASGDMKTALESVENGSQMTATLQATYMSAGMNRADIESRQDDDVDADAGDSTINSDDSDTAAEDVAERVETMLGCGAEA